MMTEAPQIQFTNKESAIKQSPQTASQQPVGGVERVREEQSRQRDDPAIVRASDGKRDRVKPYMDR